MSNFDSILAIYTKVCAFGKKDELQTLKISEVIDSEKYGYLNAGKLFFSNTLGESKYSRVLNTAEMTMAAPLL